MNRTLLGASIRALSVSSSTGHHASIDHQQVSLNFICCDTFAKSLKAKPPVRTICAGLVRSPYRSTPSTSLHASVEAIDLPTIEMVSYQWLGLKSHHCLKGQLSHVGQRTVGNDSVASVRVWSEKIKAPVVQLFH